MEKIKTYNEIKFSNEVNEMFAEIISNDTLTVRVLLFLVRKAKQNRAVTISDIIENIVVPRRVGHRKGNSRKIDRYQIEEGNIDRKMAEKVVDRLFYMSLVYIEKATPYKFVQLTVRGKQVIVQLNKRNKEDEGGTFEENSNIKHLLNYPFG